MSLFQQFVECSVFRLHPGPLHRIDDDGGRMRGAMCPSTGSRYPVVVPIAVIRYLIDLFGAPIQRCPRGRANLGLLARNRDAQPLHCMHHPRLEQSWIFI